MGNRWYVAFVLLFWLASMSWLMMAKVLPPLIGGKAPDYRTALADAPRFPPPVVWHLVWEDQAIGFAANRVRPAPGGGVEMRSVVHFEQLDLDKVLQQLLGAFSALVPDVGSSGAPFQMTIATRLQFDSQKDLHALDTSVAVADIKHVLNLHGDVQDGDKLDVVVFSGNPDREGSFGGGRELLRQQVDLPPQALVSDSLAPSSDLKGLEVGQAWTIPVYRPFPPNSPVQIVEAKAERLEIIYWDRNPVEAMVVAYRSEAGAGIGSGRLLGRVWVRPDGVVLRQEVLISNLQLVFDRMPEEQGAGHAAWLDDPRFLPLLPAAPRSRSRAESE